MLPVWKTMLIYLVLMSQMMKRFYQCCMTIIHDYRNFVLICNQYCSTWPCNMTSWPEKLKQHWYWIHDYLERNHSVWSMDFYPTFLFCIGKNRLIWKVIKHHDILQRSTKNINLTDFNFISIQNEAKDKDYNKIHNLVLTTLLLIIFHS